jgi:hypothetical protein
LATSGLYIGYMSLGVGSAQVTDGMASSLSGLLASGQGASMQNMDHAQQDLFMADVTSHPAYLGAVDLFLPKGLEWNWLTLDMFRTTVDSTVVDVFALETYAVDGTWGVFVFARDSQGNIESWKMLTNLGMGGVEGTDPLISTIPVYVWSNGMAVHYISLWHWSYVGGYWIWQPWRYWWYGGSGHPNWYYSNYYWWWWHYYWWGYQWYGWYNWFYCWFYWRYFYYWSTWFVY